MQGEERFKMEARTRRTPSESKRRLGEQPQHPHRPGGRVVSHNPNRLLDREDLDTRIQGAIDKHRQPAGLKETESVRWEYTLGGAQAPPGNVQAGDTVPILQIFFGIKNGLLGMPSETTEYLWFILTVEFNPTAEVLDRAVSTSLQWLTARRRQLLNGKGM